MHVRGERGDEVVGDPVDAEAGGNVEGEVAHHEGEELKDGLRLRLGLWAGWWYGSVACMGKERDDKCLISDESILSDLTSEPSQAKGPHMARTGSSLAPGGWRIFWEMDCDTMRIRGMVKKAMVSCHPSEGWKPSQPLVSQFMPSVGPAP